MNNIESKTDPKIAAIKEIIFGENIKEYDQEFQNLRELIEHQRKEFDDAVTAAKKDFYTSFEGLKKELKADVKMIEKETVKVLQKVDRDNTVDKKRIGKMFEDLGKKLQS